MLSGLLGNKKFVYGLMTLLVFLWGFDYIVAKAALATLKPLTLVFFKYSIAVAVLFTMRCVKKKKFPLRKADIATLLMCCIVGQILYFGCEYTALAYLPASIITIILAFVPLLSIVLEIFISKKLPNFIMVAGILICIFGVAMVIGVDLEEIMSGKWIGYVLAFGAVLFWNAYNFITNGLSAKYETFDLSFMQLTCSMLILAPHAVMNLPAAEQISAPLILGVLYLGIVNACIGFSICVTGIAVLGPTPAALFSNFLPVTTALFGWIFLNEVLSSMQLWGGIIVVASSAIVIWQKGKLDGRTEILKPEKQQYGTV